MYTTQEERSELTKYSTVGAFQQDMNAGFNDNLKNVMESYTATYQIDPVADIAKILRIDTLRENYIDELLEDVNEAAFDDSYYNTMPAKLRQLIENSSMEMLQESGVEQLSPIVGITLPVLKKSYIEGHSKDIVMTEVPTKPIIKAAFERRFLKDEQGNKHYIPEIFYDNTYETIMSKGRGKEVSSAYYPTTGTLPIQDFDLLSASGGSVATRDSLALDVCIKSVIFVVDGTEYPVTVDISPNYAADGAFYASVTAPVPNSAGVVLKDNVVGRFDAYWGTVSVASTAGYVTRVQFGGHLNNENNTQTIELDRERELMEWKIPDGVRINTGLTLEKIKDYKALFDFDITTELISDISTSLSQYEDSETLNYLTDKYAEFKTKNVLPFGYTDNFTREGHFSCDVPAGRMVTQSQWIETELKFQLNRFIDELKVILRDQNLMFVVYGHPNNVTLIQDNVRWIISEDTKIGGIQLDYQFGVMTANKNRIHVLSTLKCPKSQGLRVVAYPTSKDVITFKHYKYSLNIENSYRNPFTPLTPNVMGTSRFLNTCVLPVQGEFHLYNNEFAIKPEPVPPVATCAAPVFTNGSTPITVDGTQFVNGYQVVAYSTTEGASLYYTTDGSTPTTSSAVVPTNGIITVTSSCTLKVMAAKTGFMNSTASAIEITFTPEIPTLGALTVASAAGTTTGYTVVSVTETAGAGNSFVYKFGATAPVVTYGQDLSGWTAVTADEVDAAGAAFVTVAEITADGAAVNAGNAAVVAAV